MHHRPTAWAQIFHSVSEVTAQHGLDQALCWEPALLAGLPILARIIPDTVTDDLLHSDPSQNSLWSQLRPQSRVPGGPQVEAWSCQALASQVYSHLSPREAAFLAPRRCRGSGELWSRPAPASLSGCLPWPRLGRASLL